VRIEVLGAGGAHGVPRPFCTCESCREARDKGAPYTRLCPSLYIHDLRLVIDTPEEIGVQLNRARIERVEAALYSHWHPDHTAGSRVFEANADPQVTWASPPERYCTSVFIPERVMQTFAEYHALTTRMRYLEALGVIALQVIPMGQSITYQSVTITPFVLAEDYACGFVFQAANKRILICMDELNGWMPPAWLGRLDLAILPAGVFEFHPLTGQRVIPAGHPILVREATYAETLDMVQALDVGRVVFIHLNHSDQLTFDQFRELGRRMTAAAGGKRQVEFAYDGLIVDG
jgi:phosphoribosyl 1,2-cyclic phosphate phosphodiesterase